MPFDKRVKVRGRERESQRGEAKERVRVKKEDVEGVNNRETMFPAFFFFCIPRSLFSFFLFFYMPVILSGCCVW